MTKKIFQIYSILLLFGSTTKIGAMEQEIEQEKVVIPAPPASKDAPVILPKTTTSSKPNSAFDLATAISNVQLKKTAVTSPSKEKDSANLEESPMRFNTSLIAIANNNNKASDDASKPSESDWDEDEEDYEAAKLSRRRAALASTLKNAVDTKAVLNDAVNKKPAFLTPNRTELLNRPPAESFSATAPSTPVTETADQKNTHTNSLLEGAIEKLTRLCESRRPHALEEVKKHVEEVKKQFTNEDLVKEVINARYKYGTALCYALDANNLDVCTYLVDQGADTTVKYEDFDADGKGSLRAVGEVLELRTQKQSERKQLKEDVAKLNDLISFHSLEEVKTHVEEVKRKVSHELFVRDFINAGKAKRKPLHNAITADKLNLCLYLAEQGADTTLKINNRTIAQILEAAVQKLEEARREQEQEEREFEEKMAQIERKRAKALEDLKIADETAPLAYELIELCKSKEENALEEVTQYVEEIKAKLSSEFFLHHFINAGDCYGTPLQYAIDANNLAIYAYLVEQGADTTVEYKDDYLDENGDNRTIADVFKIKAQEREIKPLAKKLKTLCMSKDQNALEEVKNYVEEIKATLSPEIFVKYFINARFKQRTPVCYAIDAGNLDICAYLADQGTDMSFEFYDKDYTSKTVAQALEIKTQELRENQSIQEIKPLARKLKVLCKSTKENILVQVREYVEDIKTKLPDEVFVKHLINAQFKRGTPIRYAIESNNLELCTYLVKLGADTKLVCRYDTRSISQLLEEQKELEIKRQALLKEAGEQQTVDLPAAVEKLIELCSEPCFTLANLNDNALAIRTHIEVMKAKLSPVSFVQDFIKAKKDEPIGGALMAANMVDAPELVSGKLEICAYLGSLGADMAQTYAGKTVTESIQEAAEQEAQKLKELDEVALKQLAILEARKQETARLAREKAEHEEEARKRRETLEAQPKETIGLDPEKVEQEANRSEQDITETATGFTPPVAPPFNPPPVVKKPAKTATKAQPKSPSKQPAGVNVSQSPLFLKMQGQNATHAESTEHAASQEDVGRPITEPSAPLTTQSVSEVQGGYAPPPQAPVFKAAVKAPKKNVLAGTLPRTAHKSAPKSLTGAADVAQSPLFKKQQEQSMTAGTTSQAKQPLLPVSPTSEQPVLKRPGTAQIPKPLLKNSSAKDAERLKREKAEQEEAARSLAIKAQQEESERNAKNGNDDLKKPRSWWSTIGKITGVAALIAGGAWLKSNYVKKQEPGQDAQKEQSKQVTALQEQSAQQQPQTQTA